ncbi:hypothetical protein OG863_39160 [Streptomyces decoyicus]|uniref:DUF4274 domain-containing protein n=1 Tax=Streptomyces decoyicus TaxID=249567 RepID=A0ABZ1FSL6_9ACTN|nr:hypothetical protein [Streptomyces decoyicus]WSB73483.1 hypothetical protein OG863_39160 [Streptomyces decoyicus]
MITVTKNETSPAPHPVDVDIEDIEELVASWEELAFKYDYGQNSAYDRRVLDCAARLAADPGGSLAYVWVFGMVVAGRYLNWLPGDGVKEAALRALRTAEAALSAPGCAHASHPYEIHDEEEDEELAGWLVPLLDESEEWYEDWSRDQWRCPCNAAGFARIALDALDPGSVTNVPPRLPQEAHDTLDSLSAFLEGYPQCGTDVEAEIEEQGWALKAAEAPDDRSGRIMVVRAVAWYAASGVVRRKAVLDGLISALEKALSHYDAGTCPHGDDEHPVLPDTAPAAAAIGIELSYPGGRALYERRRAENDKCSASLELLLCPGFIVEIGQESLTLLRERRDRFFGPCS